MSTLEVQPDVTFTTVEKWIESTKFAMQLFRYGREFQKKTNVLGQIGHEMRINIFPLVFMVLSATGCTGKFWSDRADSPNGTGPTITFDERLFRDIEFVLEKCSNVVLPAGLDHIRGIELFVPNCRSSVTGELDVNQITQNQPRPEALRAIALYMAIIDRPLSPRLPSILFEKDSSIRLTTATWLLPMIENSLTEAKLPDMVREGFLAIVRPIIADSDCMLQLFTSASFESIRLRNIAFSWDRATSGGQRLLVVTAEIEESEPQLGISLLSEITCGNGNSRPDVPNRLLEASLPDNNIPVQLIGGKIRAEFELSLPPLNSDTAGDILVRARRPQIEIRRIELDSMNHLLEDALVQNFMRDSDITPNSIEQSLQPRLYKIMRNIDDLVGKLLLDALDIENTRTEKRSLRVVGIDVDTSAGSGRHSMRFSTLRGDKLCYSITPGRHVNGRLVSGEKQQLCVENRIGDIQTEDKQQCFKIRDENICLPPPVSP